MSSAQQSAARLAAYLQAVGTSGMWTIDETTQNLDGGATTTAYLTMCYVSGEDAEKTLFEGPENVTIQLPLDGARAFVGGVEKTVLSVRFQDGNQIAVEFAYVIAGPSVLIRIELATNLLEGTGIEAGGGAIVELNTP